MRLLGSAIFTATFNQVTKCLTTVIFGTLKDAGLLVDSLASIIVLATETASYKFDV